MISKNPLEGHLSLDELFPSPSEMVHGDAELVKRAFAIIFCALDLSRSSMGKRGIADVWAAAFLASTFGMKRDGEDAEAIRQVSGDLAIITSTPQDIRLYSIYRRIEAAEKASQDPEGFRGLGMLVNSQQEQSDMMTSEIWACVRDAFAIYERLVAEDGDKIQFLYPASSGLLMRVRGFILDTQTAEYHMHSGESWQDYVQRLWDGVISHTFPYVGLADELKDSSHEEVDGRELAERRIVQGLRGRYKFPEGFDKGILAEVRKPFMTCELFQDEGRRYREMIAKDYDPRKYPKQYKETLRSIRYCTPTTVMPKSSFDKMLEDGEFKSMWQLPPEEWDDYYCDRPEDARALNDKRLFGEKGGRITYAMLVLPIEQDDSVNHNTAHLAQTYGKDDPVLVQFTGHVREQATLTWGDSFQNFVSVPYSTEALAWLLEARFFLNMLRSHPMAQEIMPTLHETNSLWLSFLQMTFGQKHPYFEIQIHGRIGLDWIKSANHIPQDSEESTDLTPMVKKEIKRKHAN